MLPISRHGKAGSYGYVRAHLVVNMTLNSSMEHTYVYGLTGVNIWGSQTWPDIKIGEVPATIRLFPWELGDL